MDGLPEFVVNGRSTQDKISALNGAYSFRLPQDYLDFLLATDGGEGFVGARYIVVWRTDEVVRFNEEYQFPKYAPRFVCFGSNGGGEGFAFDLGGTTEGQVVQIPFIGMSPESAMPVVDSFSHLFRR